MSATIWAGTLSEALVFIPILVRVTQSLVCYLRFIVRLFVPFMLVIIMYAF